MPRLSAFPIALLACVASAAAIAAPQPIEPGLEYLLKVSAPVMKPYCEPIDPGYSARVDELYPAWLERNARQIEASKAQMLEAMHASGSGEDVDAFILKILKDTWGEYDAKGDTEGQKKGCEDIIDNLASTETNPVK